jgi:hypothetical protein
VSLSWRLTSWLLTLPALVKYSASVVVRFCRVGRTYSLSVVRKGFERVFGCAHEECGRRFAEYIRGAELRVSFVALVMPGCPSRLYCAELCEVSLDALCGAAVLWSRGEDLSAAILGERLRRPCEECVQGNVCFDAILRGECSMFSTLLTRGPVADGVPGALCTGHLSFFL